MKGKLKTGPSVEPLTVAQAKDYMKVEVNNEDTLIADLIVGARKLVESETGKALLEQEWYFYADCFPNSNELRLTKGPVISFDVVEVILDGASAYSTLASTYYEEDTESRVPKITLAPNQTWPTLEEVPNAVRVTATMGFGTVAGSVPRDLMIALRLLLLHFYDKRGVDEEIPEAVDRLLADFRDNLFG